MADIAGLDEAIEAGKRAAWTHDPDFGVRDSIADRAIRAAAPVLVRAALRQAADEIPCDCFAGDDYHCEHWAEWLRRRADSLTQTGTEQT